MDYSFCPMSPARHYTAATLRNPALDDENMEVIAQMDAVAPLVAQAYLLTTGCALRASRRAAHAPKRDPLYNSCQFERLARNNRWRTARDPPRTSWLRILVVDTIACGS